MPVYEHPGLLADTSQALRSRMQGKSCFNFTAVDRALFEELDRLTGRCAKAVRQPGLVPAAGDQVGALLGDHLGLAAAGAGEHEQGAAGVGDRFFLGGVEAGHEGRDSNH